ncbi:hypothetical protein [Neolewinella litorea]|uniref:Uncharacterized protein n=1 Tax=Neolewinella litorea TaxID=2562452 RepID=A0A4V3XK54_9BACT|nr:hypothetical protein [Neolewinella litorea]THH35623.1 hypothetical protein E4021_16175 [Neolewinella litorea]
MSRFFDLPDLRQTLTRRSNPSIVSWNRLEGRPRSADFPRALRAEVRDPLWMVARQWQMGELTGDDAGSPVYAKAHLHTTKIRQYQPGSRSARPFDDNTPLETQVECRPVPLVIAGQDVALDLRLLMGRYWSRLLNNAALAATYRTRYALKLPDPTTAAGAPIFAHPEVWQQWAAVSGRRMDGFALYAYLKEAPGNRASDGIAGAGATQDDLGDSFITWFEALFFQPQADQDAWEPSRLEYRFQLSAPVGRKEKVLAAEEYFHGHLDWYNLDHDTQTAQLGAVPIPPDPTAEASHTNTFIPTQVTFAGMPNTRWWTFEDGKTNFGEIKPNRNEIGRLLVMEFGLVYANDWFLLPVTVGAGTLSLVRGLAVTNVFGERTWVEAGSKGLDDDFSRWSLFTLNTKGKRKEPADLTLTILPTVPKIQEGKPQEEIVLVRDEMANLVWGIETRVASPNGGSLDGRAAAAETRRYFERLAGIVPADLPEFAADLRYDVMSTLPENWIPFQATRLPGSTEQIQLQRSSMLRFFTGDPERPRKIKPRNTLLRPGLDERPVEPYFLAEEEVPRSGVVVSQSFQRTRWYDGRVFTWLGVRKQVGRGEGSSGLAFDRVLPVKS